MHIQPGKSRKISLLSRAFLTPVFAIVVLSQLLLVAWTYRQEKRTMEADLVGKVTLATELLGSSAARAIIEFDSTHLAMLIDRTLKDRDFVSVQVLDENRSPVMERIGKGNDLRKLLLPVTRGDQKLGTVETTYTTSRIQKELISRVVSKATVGVIAILLLTFIVIYFFRIRVVQRVESMQWAMSKATEGDLTVHVEDDRRDELSGIAHGINYLVEQLRDAITRISGLSGDVSATTNALFARFEEVTASMSQQKVSTEEIFHAVDNLNRSQSMISRSTGALHEFSEENSAAVGQTMVLSQNIAERMEVLAEGMHKAQETIAAMELTSQELSRLSSEADRNVGQAVVSAGEMRHSLNTVTNLISASAEQSDRTTAVVSEKGIAAFGEAEKNMARIQSLSESLASTIDNLGSGSKNIAKILAVISDVTERTKMLSLNASIIAAQSGEHGKGFMVVADEMKGLSDQTAQSTKEIVAILRGIQAGIADAVKEARDASKTVQEGQRVIFHAGNALQEILDSSRESGHMVREILNAAQLQQNRLENIVSTLEQLHHFSSGVSRAIIDDERNLAQFSRMFGKLHLEAEAARRATDEQVVTMQHVMDNISLAASQASEIAAELAANESEGRVIAGAVGDVVAVTEQTTGAVTEASEKILQVVSSLQVLSQEMERFKTR